MMRIAFLGASAALAGSALAQTAPDLRPAVVVGEASGPVRVQMGQLLEVRLPVQAGTGYSWAASSDTGNLEFIDQTTLHPWGGSPAVGGSQTQMFIYRAIGPGMVTLRFVYRRPWEAAFLRQRRLSRWSRSSLSLGRGLQRPTG